MYILKKFFTGENKSRITDFFCGISLISSVITAIYCMINLQRKIDFNKENFGIFAAKSALTFFSKDIFNNIFSPEISENNDELLNNFNRIGFWNCNAAMEWNKDFAMNSENLRPRETNAQLLSENLDFDNCEFIGADDEKHCPGEKTYRVIETHFPLNGTTYEKVCVKNTTNFDLDIAAELAKKPEICIKNTDKPQVLVFHTHTSESYMTHDRDFCYENFYPRSRDNSKNVTMVGEAIVKNLKKNGINAVHCTVHHDDPTYNGSYARAAKTIKEFIEKYPSIQVVIDVHRDSIGDNSSGKIKPMFVFNGKKVAQLMIISGCDLNGKIGFPNWEKNLRLALRMQMACETMFPGITRPMKFAEVKYNMNLTNGSMLVEVGSDVNTLSEAVCTGEMFGEALSKVLNSLKN